MNNYQLDNIQTISKEDVAKQQENFEQLLGKLGKADVRQVEQVSSKRETVNLEPALIPDIVEKLKTEIKNERL